jgi:hypothetical protein
VLQTELLSGKSAHCRQHLVGSSSLGHGEHQVMDQLARPPAWPTAIGIAVPSLRRRKIPGIHQPGRCFLPAQGSPVIGLNL